MLIRAVAISFVVNKSILMNTTILHSQQSMSEMTISYKEMKIYFLIRV